MNEMSADMKIAIVIVATIVLGTVACVGIGCWSTHADKVAAFENGYEQVQLAGTTAMMWQKGE